MPQPVGVGETRPTGPALEVVQADGFQPIDIQAEWSSLPWSDAVVVRRSTPSATVALVVARPPAHTDGLALLARSTCSPARLERVQRRAESLSAHAVLVLAVGAATHWQVVEEQILVDVRPSGAPAVSVAGLAGSVSVSLSHERDLIAALARVEL